MFDALAQTCTETVKNWNEDKMIKKVADNNFIKKIDLTQNLFELRI